jgi:hypothetical protein
VDELVTLRCTTPARIGARLIEPGDSVVYDPATRTAYVVTQAGQMAELAELHAAGILEAVSGDASRLPAATPQRRPDARARRRQETTLALVRVG